MDYKSQAKKSTSTSWALACGVALLLSLPSETFAQNEPKLIGNLPVPVSLITRKGADGDDWVYKMSDDSLRVYDHKLKNIPDERLALEKLTQTPTFRRYRKVAIALKPVVDVAAVTAQVLLWTLL